MGMIQVAGACKKTVFRKIQTHVEEKLNQTERKSISFRMMDELSVSTRLLIQELINQAVAVQDTERRLDLIMVCDAEGLAGRGTEDVINLIEKIRNPDLGLFHVSVTLIWMTGEYQEGSSKARNASLEKLARNQSIARVVMLTDRCSNLASSDENLRIQAAALVISAYPHLTATQFEPGLYTVGVGSQEITQENVADYARSKAAEAIMRRSLTLKNKPEMEMLCARAFDTDDRAMSLKEHVQEIVASVCVTNFCYISGEGEHHSGAEKNPQMDVLLQDKVDAWSRKMKVLMARMLYPEDARDFFKSDEASKFEMMLSGIRAEFGGGFNAALRFPLFGEGKKAGLAYQQFMSERQRNVAACVEELCRRWRATRSNLEEYARQLIARRDTLLSTYQCEPAFADRCERLAQTYMKDIRDRIVSRITPDQNDLISWIDEQEDGDGRLNDTVIRKLLDWVQEQVMTESHTSLFSDMAAWDLSQINSRVLSPIGNEARVSLACRRHAEMPASRTVCCFLPAFLPDLANRNIQMLGTEPRMIRVNNQNYRNIEAVALVWLAASQDMEKEAKNLTAFAPDMDDDNPAVHRNAEQQPDVLQDEKPEEQEPAGKSGQDQGKTARSPWGLQISGQTVSINWPDRTIKEVNIQLDGKKVATIRFEAMDYSKEIPQAGTPGKHTLRIINPDNGGVLDAVEFSGKKDILQYGKRKTKTVSLSQDAVLETYELYVYDVVPGDGAGGQGTPPPFDRLLMQHGRDAVALGNPKKIGRAPYTWFVAEIAGVPYELSVTEELLSNYEIIRV